MTVVPADIEDLARAVAERSGVTLEQVLRQAVEMDAHLAGVDLRPASAAPKPANLPAAREIVRRVARLPLLDARSPALILEDAWSGADDRGR